MKYLGSKNRIAKHILPIILKDRKEGQFYVEPFCGGCNSLDKVTGNRVGNDSNEYLIAMFKALGSGWIPPEVVTEDLYGMVKSCPDGYNPWLVGFVGFCCSFGSKWFGGYARGKNSKGEPRNYASESKRYLLRQAPLLDGVIFHSGSYDSFPIPSNSIIYCDPPYAGTTGYRDEFDHAKFWQWCREKKAEAHKVFVSEYNAPEDFSCVWSGEQTTTVSRGEGKKAIEKLFTL